MIDEGRLEKHLRFLLNANEDVAEGEAGVALGQLLCRDVMARLAQHFSLHARGNDLRIDEHAVAIENDEIRSWHGRTCALGLDETEPITPERPPAQLGCRRTCGPSRRAGARREGPAWSRGYSDSTSYSIFTSVRSPAWTVATKYLS